MIASSRLPALLLLLPILLSPGAGAQAAHPSAPGSPAGVVSAPTAADQQAALLADVERLRRMAETLKAQVDKTRRDELNVQVVRQADEIEKLARNTRSRIH